MTVLKSGEHRIFVRYIDKSREYYLAQGFTNPYRWASHGAALQKPLKEVRMGLVTTATLINEEHAPRPAPPSTIRTPRLR